MIYTVGETVLDIIFKNIDDVKVKPGGSLLNTAVSLGRLGLDVSHVSVLSADKLSDMLIEFLRGSGVGTNLIQRDGKIKTNLAFAYLDKKNNAEYIFYKDRYGLDDAVGVTELKGKDIIHYGSFFSINPDMHGKLHQFLGRASEKGCVKLYDPNFRKPHLPQLDELLPMIESNFGMADIVKGSDEDFENIFGVGTGGEAWERMRDFGVKLFFYTKGVNGAEVFTSKGSVAVMADTVNVVSSIGAGDTFSAGIIYHIVKQSVGLNNLDSVSLRQWGLCAGVSHKFAAQTCQSLDNYLSPGFCKQFTDV